MANNDRFTGGDDLTGLQKKYHDIMMQNELRGGKGAYKLSWAGGKSGPSFGGNQMDIGQDDRGIKALRKIIPNARDANNQLIFSDEDRKKLLAEVDFDKKINFVGKRPVEVFDKFLPKVNQALGSEYGKQEVNKAYKDFMEKQADYIDGIVRNIKHPGAKAFYQADKGKVLLFDYHNQFNLAPDGLLAKYINGVKIKMHNGEILSIKDKETFTLEDHKNFIYNTRQGVEKYADASRRLENIDEYMDEEVVIVADEVSEAENANYATTSGAFNALKAVRELSKIKDQQFKELKDKIKEKYDTHKNVNKAQFEKDASDKFSSLKASADHECAQRKQQIEASTPCNEKNSYHTDKQCHLDTCTIIYHCKIPVDCSDINAKYNQMYLESVEKLEQDNNDGFKKFKEQLISDYNKETKDIQKSFVDSVKALIGDDLAKEIIDDYNMMELGY